MTTVLQLLGLLVLAGVVTVAAVAGLAVWALRRLRRTTRRVLARPAVRAALSDSPRWVVAPRLAGSPRQAALRMRALVPGPQRAVAGLRSQLHREVASTRALVVAAERGGRPVGQLGALTRQLQQHARSLDVDLAAVSAEPDPALRRELLATHSHRVAELRTGCAHVRDGVRAAGLATTAPLDELLDELDAEVLGLRLRARAYAELI